MDHRETTCVLSLRTDINYLATSIGLLRASHNLILYELTIDFQIDGVAEIELRVHPK